MKLFGVNFWRIIFPAIVFPTFLGVGVIYFQVFALPKFAPMAFNLHEVTNYPINQKKLAPARKLTSKWVGTAKFKFFNPNFSDFCYIWDRATLTIDGQLENAIGGNIEFKTEKVENPGNFTCYVGGEGTGNGDVLYNISAGTAGGTRISFKAGDRGNFTGSFTTDTMTLNPSPKQDKQPRIVLVTPLNLLRQQQ